MGSRGGINREVGKFSYEKPETLSHIIYPTGQKYSLELMLAKFATVKIANELIPLKISTTRLALDA